MGLGVVRGTEEGWVHSVCIRGMCICGEGGGRVRERLRFMGRVGELQIS